MNSVNSQKYSYTHNAIEEKIVEAERFRDIYNFYRLVKIKQHAERYECTDVEKDKKLCRKLREPLKIGEKVLALAEHLKKKDAPGNIRAQPKTSHFSATSKYSYSEKLLKVPIIINIGSQKKEKTKYLINISWGKNYLH